MTGFLGQLSRDRRGASVIELAMVAPVLAMMVMGVTDISNAYGRKLQIEQAAQRAIEKVMQTTGENTPEDTIKVEAMCQFNGVDAETGDCNTAPLTADDITVEYTLTCDTTDTEYNLDCAPGEVEVRYITATVTTTYTPLFPVHWGTDTDGTYHLSVTAGVRVA